MLKHIKYAHYGLQLGSRQHELHLLSQHGRRGLLLDQVVPPVNLQLRFQVRRWMQIFTVLTGAAPLKRREEGGRSSVRAGVTPRVM